jgi:hypothetical protein
MHLPKTQSSSPMRQRSNLHIFAPPQLNGMSLQMLIGEIVTDQSSQKKQDDKRLRFSKPPSKFPLSPLRSKEPKLIKDVSLPILQERESVLKMKKAKREADKQKAVMESLHYLPQLLVTSDELLKKANNSATDNNSNEYNAKISTIISKQKVNLGEHMPIIEAYRALESTSEEPLSHKWNLKYIRKSIEGIAACMHDATFYPTKLSNSMVEDADKVALKNFSIVGQEVSGKLNSIEAEKSKLEILLKRASYEDKSGLPLLAAVKEEKVDKVREECLRNPSLISKQYTVPILCS